MRVFILLSEFLFEFPQFDLILPEQRSLIDIFVDPRLILDLLGPRGELERGYGLAEALPRRRYHRHHRRLAVAAQRVLQQTRQLRVAVRNVRTRTLVRQSSYHVAQARQRLIDLLRFFQSFPGSASDSHTLTTSQIYKVKLSNFDLFRSIIVNVLSIAQHLLLLFDGCHLFNDDYENSV
jgi:hypothetical protein